METTNDTELGDRGATVPSGIAGLDVEVQAMFERVRVRLGMRAGGPEMIGRYELRDWIARGGMGQVYRAYDVELEREVALKLIAPRPGSDPEVLRKRLRREAQLLAKLDHDNIIRVYDAGVHEGRVYLVMELVIGATLRQLQTAGSMSTSECLRLYAEAGRGLLAAHEKGVIHRDFKPENVFVADNGRAKVGDFGLGHVLGDELARGELPAEATAEGDEPEGDEPEGDEPEGAPFERGSRLTEAGEVLGTPGYMAPEQLCGEEVDARADQYGFCVALWEALADQRPFAGASAQALIAAMQEQPRGGELIDARLRKVLQTGLALAPEQRHQSLAQVLDGLDERLQRPARRRRRGIYGAVGVLAMIAASLGLLFGARTDDCPLAQEVRDLREQNPRQLIATMSSDVAAAGKITRWLDQMELKADKACRRSNLASDQHLGRVVRSMGSLLKRIRSGPEPAELNDLLTNFEHIFVSEFSVRMWFVRDIWLAMRLEPLEMAGENDEIVAWCDEVLPKSESWPAADRAELLLRCARVQSLTGQSYDDAVAAYKEARGLAEEIGDGQRRLEANLGAAKTTIMRLQAYERGDELLDAASDLLVSLDVGTSDPRRAGYEELAGILVREYGDPKEAVRLQLRVVGSQLRGGSKGELVAALVNLGNALDKAEQAERAEQAEKTGQAEKMGDSELAKFAYRRALTLDPDDPEASVALGFVLSNDGHLDEARVMLERALVAENHDLVFGAMLGLLSIEVDDDDKDPVALARYRDRLTEMLPAPDEYSRPPSECSCPPSQEGLAWSYITLAHAHLGEFGPAYQSAYSEVPPDMLAEIDAIVADIQDTDKDPNDP